MDDLNREILVHFTTERCFRSITEVDLTIGSVYGVFALTEQGAAKPRACRWLGTLSSAPRPQRILMTGPACEAFLPPPLVGPFSALRRRLGVRAAPLGSVDLLWRVNIGAPASEPPLYVAYFQANEIFDGTLFRSATSWERWRAQIHQWLLDYVVDLGIWACLAALLALLLL